jgi:hypothetical protein
MIFAKNLDELQTPLVSNSESAQECASFVVF